MPHGMFDFGPIEYLLIFIMIALLGPYALFDNMVHEMGWGFGPMTDIGPLEDIYVYPLFIGLACLAVCVGIIARSKNRSVILWCIFACLFPASILVLIFLSKLNFDNPLENTLCEEHSITDTKTCKHDKLDV